MRESSSDKPKDHQRPRAGAAPNLGAFDDADAQDADDGLEERRTADIIGYLTAHPRGVCSRCATAICGHELVIATAMGLKDAPVCLGCLAASLGRERTELRGHLLAHISRRACFRQGWLHASRAEGYVGALQPGCLWGAASVAAPSVGAQVVAAAGEPPTASTVRYDAGDIGCGDLVMDLRAKLREMAPGSLLALRATDPGAREDIPAWCGLTGHSLVSAAHPEYLIRRKQAP